MATSPNTGQTTKQRFWSKFKVAPRPIPRRKRGTSDSAQITPSPPSLPSLPSHAHKPRKKATPTKRCEDEFPCYKFLSEEMTLPEFAQQFQNDLPQQVVVTRGVYWRENLEVNISSSERLNIHFIRHRESVKIKELGSSTEYSVPVTSTLEFGLVYNPFNHSVKDALRGFLYPTIEDVIKVVESAPLPRLISATSDSSHTTPGDRVSKGELLLIKEVRSCKMLGYKQLQVTSLTTKTDKYLHESCRGNFTTRPESIKLSLFSIIKYIPNAIPLSVMIFPGENLDLGDEYYPSHLFQKVIQLSRTFTDVLLVASSVPDGSVCDGREPFEIPQEVELELKVVELSEGDRDPLREKSEQIMKKIQGEYIKQYRNAHRDQANYVVQEMFLRAVGASEDEPQKKTPVAPPRKRKSASVDSDYPNVTPVHEGLLSRLGKLEDAVWKMKKAQASASAIGNGAVKEGEKETEKEGEKETEKEGEKETEKEGEGETEKEGEGERETASVVQSLEEKLKEKEEQVELVESTVTELKSVVQLQQQQFQEELQRMSAELAALRGEVEDGRGEGGSSVSLQQVTSLYQEGLLATPETAQRNRDIVSTLTAPQVLQLLTEVGVEDLQLVARENVTGDILIELNEAELETELGITRRIQRLKVMKVTSGSKSVTEYLKIHELSSMDHVC